MSVLSPSSASVLPRRLALLALLSSVVAGCAGEAPYLLTDYRYHQRNQVIVCFNEARNKLADAKAMADGVCEQYDRTSQLALLQPNQCSFTAPTQAVFTCAARPGETPAPMPRRSAPMRHDAPLPTE